MSGDTHQHVGLLAGYNRNGDPVIEQTPAVSLGGGSYRILGTPGLANGCATDDVVDVDDAGEFSVTRRGGNIAVHFYGTAGVSEDQIASLRHAFGALAGSTETPDDRRFVIVTVPAVSGFPAIEKAANNWVEQNVSVEWHFGNVYDDQGTPLNWWRSSPVDPARRS